MSSTSTRSTTDFKPLHNPGLSPVPDLYAWVIKQPKEFQAQLAMMPLEAFKRTQFVTYCPHCMIDHKCMTLTIGRPSGTTQGVCIQCQLFLKTGHRSMLQR